jgi:hypothetical protein
LPHPSHSSSLMMLINGEEHKLKSSSCNFPFATPFYGVKYVNYITRCSILMLCKHCSKLVNEGNTRFPPESGNVTVGPFCCYSSVMEHSEVGISQHSNRLLPGWLRTPGSIPGRGKIFLFCTASRLALGPIRPPTQWTLWTISPGVKLLQQEADHSPLSSVQVKNGGTIHPLSHMSCHNA